MTGEVIGDLLRPLIGKSGTIFMVVGSSGQIGFATGPNRKLTGVEIAVSTTDRRLTPIPARISRA